MNIRTLIQRAIQEARADFELIVTRRIGELMGDEAHQTHAPPATASGAAKRPVGRPRGSKNAAKPANKQPAKASSGSVGRGGSLDDMILRALGKGELLGKSKLMSMTGLSDKDEVRVSLALARLREAGRIVMSGARRGAKYRIRGAAGGAAKEAAKSSAAAQKPRVRNRAKKSAAPAVAAPAEEWHPTVIRRKREDGGAEGEPGVSNDVETAAPTTSVES